MSVLDDWRDLSSGHVRVETGEYTDRERRKLRQGSVLFVVGLIVLATGGDYWTATFAMAIAGVFLHLWGDADG